MELVSYKSINEIDDSHWDSIINNDNLFHTHRFLKTIEDSSNKKTKFIYLLFYANNKLIASAVLCSYKISLDLLTKGIYKSFISSTRLIFPNFLKINTLICGLPISLGQNNIVIANPEYSREVVIALYEKMSQICQSESIKFQCVKEFLEHDCNSMDDLTEFEFFRAYSLPYMSIDIRWKNFQEYLDNLRHHYRRTIKISLRKIEQNEPKIHKSHNSPIFQGSPRLFIYKPKDFSARVFYKLYSSVMENAEIKLETLDERFFEKLFIKLENDLEILAMEDNDEIIGAAIFSVKGETMTFVLVGINYAVLSKYDVYFNLVFGLLSLSMERGCKRLNLGQTSYWFKQRIGGDYEHEYFYFKAQNGILHKLIESFHYRLFPKYVLRTINVFKNR